MHAHNYLPLHVVKSFLELVPYLPNAPSFTSRRISQDPLEKFLDYNDSVEK